MRASSVSALRKPTQAICPNKHRPASEKRSSRVTINWTTLAE
ncbi:hypothetical protein ACMZ4X_03350 [Achromobacter marplatensis]